MPSALQIVRKYFPKVTKVNDADKNLKIEVTKRDNAHGKVRNHQACALAVACKRVTGMDGVIISIATAYLIKGNTAWRYYLPESASREIVSVDRNAPLGFDEGMYELKAHRKGDRLGDRKERKTGNSEPTGPMKAKVFRHFTHGIRAALGSRRAPDGITRAHG
jgi:hypothetical protein